MNTTIEIPAPVFTLHAEETGERRETEFVSVFTVQVWVGTKPVFQRVYNDSVEDRDTDRHVWTLKEAQERALEEFAVKISGLLGA